VELPAGRLEVLGLRRWTPTVIQDSLERKAPGESLASYACAAALRDELHFAEAMAVYFAGGDSATSTVVVAVVEPQDSALVRHRALPRDTLKAHRQAPWTALVDLAAARPGLWRRIVLARAEGRLQGKAPEVPPPDLADSAVYRVMWALLDAHQGPNDLAEARQVLTTAPYLYDRVAALAILTSFLAHDPAWHTLVGALLEPDGQTRIQAVQILASLAPFAPRAVEWAPAASDLHAILNGSALVGLTDMLKLLVATKVDSKLAGVLLKGGGHGVLMYAGAQHPAFREPALAVLRQLSGQDFGRDVHHWEAWIEAL
jgi:hypothetical protein